MGTAQKPQGLAFLERIAALVCAEYEFAYTWEREGDFYIMTVKCGQHDLVARFERRVLDDPGSDEYRLVVEHLFSRLLEEFRARKQAEGC